jgi:fructose-1,6-bisphosphatase/inositol monophosphatase family enzyme
MTEIDIEVVDDLIGVIAEVEIMPRFGRLAESEVTEKTSAFDVVSAADKATETAIFEALGERYPSAVVIGEEAADADPSILAGMDDIELAVLLDPLDGTKNFVSGLPLFAVMAGVVRFGEVIAGVIHDPVTGISAIAAKGSGAWIRRDGATQTRLHVADPVPLHEMEAIAGTRFVADPLRAILTANLPRIAGHTWFRCAGHEYKLAAAGQCHVLCYHRLMPWDHAAGWLLHQEAGGYSAHFDGTPFRLSRMSGGLLCAPDESSWHVANTGLLTTEG